MLDNYTLIKNICLNANTSDPITLAKDIMKNENINIHGPIHHIIDGACFMTAMHNAGAKFDLDKALDEMIARGQKMPGATCGQWGMCGSSSSIGAALAIIHETGPLSNNEYYQDNLYLVSKALAKIADVGGPRCCKRNAFLSLSSAIDFVEEKYAIRLTKQAIKCDFSNQNKQCIGIRCPFYKTDTQ